MSKYSSRKEQLFAKATMYRTTDLTDEEMLELLLYQTAPDTAPTVAKTLLNTFGNIGRVMSATESQLMRIDGVSIATSKSILATSLMCQYLLKGQMNRITLHNTEDIYDYCIRLLIPNEIEELYVVCLGQNGEILGKAVFTEQRDDRVTVSIKQLTETALFYNASRVFIAHSHPGGDTTPSVADNELSQNLYNVLRSLNIYLTEHIIVSKKGTYSYFLEGELKNYSSQYEQLHTVQK